MDQKSCQESKIEAPIGCARNTRNTQNIHYKYWSNLCEWPRMLRGSMEVVTQHRKSQGWKVF